MVRTIAPPCAAKRCASHPLSNLLAAIARSIVGTDYGGLIVLSESPFWLSDCSKWMGCLTLPL
jgi:hypothetical protein